MAAFAGTKCGEGEDPASIKVPPASAVDCDGCVDQFSIVVVYKSTWSRLPSLPYPKVAVEEIAGARPSPRPSFYLPTPSSIDSDNARAYASPYGVSPCQKPAILPVLFFFLL